MTEAVLVKPREGNQYETIEEPAGFTVIRAPHGACQGNRVALSFDPAGIKWLVGHLGEWVRNYATSDARALQKLFVEGDAPAPAPMPQPIAQTAPAARPTL
jgi:hypothetical protein